MALEQQDKTEIGTMITTALKPVTDSLAKLGETVSKAPTVEALTKTVTDALAPKLTELEGKIAAGPTAPEKKEAPKDDKGNEIPAHILKLTEAVDKLGERFSKIDGEMTSQAEDRRVRELIKTYCTENKLPGLLSNERVFNRLVAMKPKDAAGLKECIEGEKTYLSSIGVNVEKWGAEPDAEGAKDSKGNPTGKFDEPAEVERIKNLPRGAV